MFRRKMHVYHVYYTHSYGHGSITMYMKKKINTPSLIQEVREYIQESSGKDNIVISNLIKLKKAHLSKE